MHVQQRNGNLFEQFQKRNHSLLADTAGSCRKRKFMSVMRLIALKLPGEGGNAEDFSVRRKNLC